jgi:hypothetical protein
MANSSRRSFLAAGGGCAARLALAAADSESTATRPSKLISLLNGGDLNNWYAWLKDNHYQDPQRVFTMRDGMLRISGEEWGGLTTRETYRDYQLVAEWKWGGPSHGTRAHAARDSGILVHGRGKDGAYGGVWLESIECQVIEGGCGDIILVGGEGHPQLTVETKVGTNGDLYWSKGGTPVTRDRGRFDWFARDPAWKDALGFRGAHDVEKPTGEWNRSEVLCEGGAITNIVNGVTVNHGTGSSHTEGKIQLQSEGAEIWFRKVELLPLKRKGS